MIFIAYNHTTYVPLPMVQDLKDVEGREQKQP